MYGIYMYIDIYLYLCLLSNVREVVSALTQLYQSRDSEDNTPRILPTGPPTYPTMT